MLVCRTAPLGIFYDPAVAAQAHAAGVGAKLRVQFNADETHPLSGKFAADATVVQLHDGNFIGRRGIAAGHAIALGPLRAAALRWDRRHRRQRAPAGEGPGVPRSAGRRHRRCAAR